MVRERVMKEDVDIGLVALGEQALASGDWEGARKAFSGALETADTPEAHHGLGRALWWLHDMEGAIPSLERA